MSAETAPAAPSTSLQTLGQGPSVLGERQVRLPIGGKIRAGIKVLKASVANNPRAAEIYRRGVEAGATWDAIEQRLQKDCGFDKASLVPKNVEYFTVRRSDFTIRETADSILNLYGENRGEGIQLYRFPVIFALDNWQANMPHGLRAFTTSELKYWSEYAPDGTRYCKTRAAVRVDERAQRAKRVFGGRPEIMRGPCAPNECPEYQSGQCKLSGSLVFFIPGIAGSSAFELPTTSFYAMQQWRQQMEIVAYLRGGRISGLMNGKPIFWLTKREVPISMIDPKDGKAHRRKTWIVRLEADIPTDLMFAAAEQQDEALSNGAQAATILDGAAELPPQPDETQPGTEPEGEAP